MSEKQVAPKPIDPPPSQAIGRHTQYTVIRFWSPFGVRNSILVQPVPNHSTLGTIEEVTEARGRTCFTDCKFEDSYVLFHLDDRASDEAIELIKRILNAR